MIGPHIIGSHGDYRELLKRWRPRVALLLDPPERAATEIKDWSPETFVIGRVFRDDREIGNRIVADPNAAAEWGANLIRQAASRNPDVDAWQFNNEVVQDTDKLPRLADFTRRYIELLADSGLRAAIGAFSVGRPEAPNLDQAAAWKAFAPAMRLGLQHNAVLLLHAYGRPGIFGDPQTKDSPPEWYLQRYEHVVRPFLPPEVPEMPYVYGEYGCDMRTGRGGWKTGYRENATAYVHDLELAARFLAQQPLCLGACIFTLGVVNQDWRDFDIRGEAAERLSRVAWPTPVSAGIGQHASAEALRPRMAEVAAAEPMSEHFRSVHRRSLRRSTRVRLLADHGAPDALLRRIIADGFVPSSRGFSVRSRGVVYKARSASQPQTGAERVYYYAPKGQPDDVRYVVA